MFTVKFYSPDHATKFFEAESLSVIHQPEGGHEITLHYLDGRPDFRIDIGFSDPDKPRDPAWPPIYERAIVENAAGKTTDIFGVRPVGVA